MQLTQALLGLMSGIAGVIGVAAGLFAVLPVLVSVLLLGAVPADARVPRALPQGRGRQRDG
jgi:hypothetical protein